ncbi:MAG: DUF523 domain-containing protein [Gammaproteobacteria bacterium]|nr:DUF523 domain-containing protein [Gammaproteobacteria bacterium]
MSYRKIPVAISSCLLGESVRYDGGHKQHDFILHELGEYFDFRPFCPEVSIDLGVPRPKIQLVDIEGQTRCISSVDPTLDLTAKLQNCAEQQQAWLNQVGGYIFKSRSPSCATEGVQLVTSDDREKVDSGIFAARVQLNNPLLPCTEEQHLADAEHSQPFIRRVLAYHRWCSLPDPDRSKLEGFQRWLAELAPGLTEPRVYRQLAHQLAQIDSDGLATFSEGYIRQVMAALQSPLAAGESIIDRHRFQQLLGQS